MIGNLIKPRKAAKGKPATDVLFALDHGGPSRPADHDWMGKLLFTCPVTGIRVQQWLDDDDPVKPGDSYQPIICPACVRLHFVNRKTGRLLGQKEEKAVPSAPVGAQERGHPVSSRYRRLPGLRPNLRLIKSR